MKFNGANLDFVLNPRLKVRRALDIKFAFARVVLGTEFYRFMDEILRKSSSSRRRKITRRL
ncbi:MAG: hypothetical protein D8H92_07130 [Campylobacter sp.]|nr:MAG: hypothetical protein D8H92_07130 [Campylobacter sp.]